MKLCIAILACVMLAGCGGLPILRESETFAVCKTADVATTIVALKSGKFVEANPLMKALIGGGSWVPFIAVSVAVVALIWYLDDPDATTAASAVTCGVAGNNAYLLLIK